MSLSVASCNKNTQHLQGIGRRGETEKNCDGNVSGLKALFQNSLSVLTLDLDCVKTVCLLHGSYIGRQVNEDTLWDMSCM